MQILQAAGVDFAIPGKEERCTGDFARRMGHEFLFQMQAQGNIETLAGYGVRKILTTCPHCFNTLSNEYDEFGGYTRSRITRSSSGSCPGTGGSGRRARSRGVWPTMTRATSDGTTGSSTARAPSWRASPA